MRGSSFRLTRWGVWTKRRGQRNALQSLLIPVVPSTTDGLVPLAPSTTDGLVPLAPSTTDGLCSRITHVLKQQQHYLSGVERLRPITKVFTTAHTP